MPSSHYPARTRGFTLIELSIVLVIIGLLVGGIAGFRTYTKNAALTTMMNESKYYINAFNQFQSRYNGPPGDYCAPIPPATACNGTPNASWSATVNGDGNGLIRAAAVAVPLETYYAFQHLALAGFIQGVYTGALSGGGATVGVNVPSTAILGSTFIFDHPDATDGNVSADAFYYDGFYGNVLIAAGLNDLAGSTPTVPFLTPKQARQLDEKYDDGIPGTGNLLVPKSLGVTCNTSSTVYATSGEDKTCYIILKIQ